MFKKLNSLTWKGRIPGAFTTNHRTTTKQYAPGQRRHLIQTQQVKANYKTKQLLLTSKIGTEF